MAERIREIGCILMASGLSERYGKNKLTEKLGSREIILHAAGSLTAAGFSPLAVTRSIEVKELLDREGIDCFLHDGPKKSDTIHRGLEHLSPDLDGYLFMPGDQPLVRPDSLRRMREQFQDSPERAVRLGYGSTAGSPVLFPAFCREKLMAYTGDRGGAEVLKTERVPCDILQAEFPWELWDVDTPENMEKVREVYSGAGGRADTVENQKEGRRYDKREEILKSL